MEEAGTLAEAMVVEGLHQALQEDPLEEEVHLEEEVLQEASKYNSVQFGDGEKNVQNYY